MDSYRVIANGPSDFAVEITCEMAVYKARGGLTLYSPQKLGWPLPKKKRLRDKSCVVIRFALAGRLAPTLR
jgi:hypothetical protein